MSKQSFYKLEEILIKEFKVKSKSKNIFDTLEQFRLERVLRYLERRRQRGQG